MNLKSLLAKPFAQYIHKQIRRNSSNALSDQEAMLKQLLKIGKGTVFGKDHHLEAVQTYDEFHQAVPIRDYELLKPYINQVKEGKENILWKGNLSISLKPVVPPVG